MTARRLSLLAVGAVVIATFDVFVWRSLGWPAVVISPLVLMVVVSAAVIGSPMALVISVIAGLIWDMASIAPLGLHAGVALLATTVTMIVTTRLFTTRSAMSLWSSVLLGTVTVYFLLGVTTVIVHSLMAGPVPPYSALIIPGLIQSFIHPTLALWLLRWYRGPQHQTAGQVAHLFY